MRVGVAVIIENEDDADGREEPAMCGKGVGESIAVSLGDICNWNHGGRDEAAPAAVSPTSRLDPGHTASLPLFLATFAVA